MDYRKILMAYIEHVRLKTKTARKPGTDFLGQSPGPLIGEVLSAEESIALGKARDEAASDEVRAANLRDQIARLVAERHAAVDRGSIGTANRISDRIAEKTAALEAIK